MAFRRSSIGAPVLALALAVPATPVDAQAPGTERIVPTNQVLVAGYGTVGYGFRPESPRTNAFSASLNPLLLFQFQDRILFEAELEFELEEGVTETGLEYAQLDFMASDNLVLSGGKFLVPFGVFGPRLHPTWINRFATAPPIYGHHVSSFGATPLMPVLSDIGVMARATFELGSTNLSFNAYVTQGPALEEHEDGAGNHGDGEIPELDFPGSSSDNNTSKMFGGRIDLAFAPWVEVNVSGFTSTYDEENILDFAGFNVAGEFRHSGLELRGEYMQTRQQVETRDAFPAYVRQGFYAQGSYRRGMWEPVVRWTQVFNDELDGELTREGAWQLGIGLDYWFSPSIALMAGWEINRERGPDVQNDRIVAHVSFGF